METNPLTAFVAALANTSLAPLAAYLPLVVSVAALLAAILPNPAPGSSWFPLRKLLDLLALNIGTAKNTTNGPAA